MDIHQIVMLMEIYMIILMLIKMEEQLIILKTAKLLKNKNFNWKCTHFYTTDDILLSNEYKFSTFSCVAPTQSLLQTWIRKKYKISVEVNYKTFRVKSSNGWYYSFIDIKKQSRIGYKENGKDLFSGFNSYEDALEFGLEQALEFI